MQNYSYLNDNTSSNHTNSIDSNGMKEAGQHFPSSVKITSSTISNNSDININNTNNNNNLDYKKPTAGWTLFAQLAKMTPEEVELIRLTKANTAANKQIGALPVALVSPVVVQSDSNSCSSSSSSSSTMDAPLPKSSSPKRTRQRRRELSSSPPPISLSVVSETPFLASSSEGDKSSDSRSSPLTNERGSLSPLSEYSSSSSSSSLSSVPSSQKKEIKTRSPLHAALWSSRRRKPSLSPPKSVQIDESKNMVFSYQSSSTIEALLPVDDAAGSGSSTYDNDQRLAQQEPIPIMDEVTYNRFSTRDCLDWDLPYIGYPGYKAEQEEYAKSLGTTVYTMPHTSATSPWRPLSSATAASPGSGQSGSFGNRRPSSLSSSSSSLSPSQTSWTPEAGGSLDSVLSDSGPNAFANIASSLDTLWSPPMLRRTISEVSSARRRLRPSLSTFSGPAKAAGVGESSETGVWKAPMLRRQASMPSLEREISEESPFLEQPPVRRPASSQPQESSPTMAAATGVKDPILSVLESTASIQNECQEVVMTEVESETSADPPSATIASTTIVSGSFKSSRGVIRRRDTRQLHHPYRRRASASTTLSQDGSIDETLLRLPTQFRRSASFAGTTNTPPAQPALRREASTTAYMDTL
ncbi:hypothetical protein BGZ97_000852 [Linnemannia gamsii]|uniref:Uncharacterized protein n=1 Tax=Linnemannia gamsii TaxID=64522 RepID=A0A9P6R2A0_9FUNG|nr:hypothetical protein BGZ97_000852 [Linnemannia gamsii]